MTKTIVPFEHPAFGKVRAILDETTGEPWFVAKDVAEVLRFRDAENMTRTLDEDEKGTRFVSTLGGTQRMTVINEFGLYSSVLRSRRPEATQFKRWVTHEVLPAIRKHGGYLTPAKLEEALLNPDTLIKLATALKEEQAARQEAQAKLDEAQPKAHLVDATFAKRNHQPLRLTEVVRKLDGVNTMAIKRDLLKAGYLHHTAEQYRVRHQYRGPDKFFVEKQNPHSFKHDIYATAKGAVLIAKLYYEGELTMKVGYQPFNAQQEEPTDK